MTVARIVDLAQADFSGPIGPDFTGPVNNLADPVEWLNTGGADGRPAVLRQRLSQPVRHPHRRRRRPVAVDQRQQRPGLPVSRPRVQEGSAGRPGRLPARVLRVRPAAYRRHPDRGVREPRPEPVADRHGASCRPARTRDSSWWRSTGRPMTLPWDGMSCSSIPVTGAPGLLVTALKGPTDVAPDPFGRLLIADINDSSVWLLTYTGAADVTPPVAGAITPFNTRYGNWVDSPFDLSAKFSDNERGDQLPEYTSDGGSTWQPAVVTGAMPNFTCVASGIAAANGRVLRLNMRATSEEARRRGRRSRSPSTRAASDGVRQDQQQRRVDAPADGHPDACRDGCEWCGLDVHQQHIVVHGLAAVRAGEAWTLSSRRRGEGRVRVAPGSRRERHRGSDPGPDRAGHDGPGQPDHTHEQQSCPVDLVRRPYRGDPMGGRHGCRQRRVSGYSLRWDRVPATIPDAAADTTALIATSPSLADGGNQYVHLRTVDTGWKLVGERRAPRPVLHRRDAPGQRNSDGDARNREGLARAGADSRDATSGLSATTPYRLVYSTPPTRPRGAPAARRSSSVPRRSSSIRTSSQEPGTSTGSAPPTKPGMCRRAPSGPRSPDRRRVGKRPPLDHENAPSPRTSPKHRARPVSPLVAERHS